MSAALPKVTAYAVDAMSRVADAKLHSTAYLYKDALTKPGAVQVSGTGFRITPVGKVAQMLESGWEAFDMKEKLLSSPSAKKGRNGRYADVPFRHKMSGPGAVPNDIRSHVRAVVAQEKRYAGIQDRPVKDPLRVTRGDLKGGTRTQKRITEKGTERVRVKTKVSPYADMIHSAAKSSYETIRRVSEKSDPQAWWHPGFEGVHAVTKVAASIGQVAKQIVVAELRAAKGKAR